MGNRVFHVTFLIEIPEDSGWVFEHEGEDTSDFALARRLTGIALENLLTDSTAQVDWVDGVEEAHVWNVDVRNGAPRDAREVSLD